MTPKLIVVLGIGSSGSSVLTGVLGELGVWLGRRLVGSHGFERPDVRAVCEAALRFPSVDLAMQPKQICRRLQKVVTSVLSEAGSRQYAAIKYPVLCRLWPELLEICAVPPVVIHASRPLEESCISLVRREHKWSAAAVRRHQEMLWEAKQQVLAEVDSYGVEYHDLCDCPRATIEALAGWLEIDATACQVERAVRLVDPSRRHVRLSDSEVAA